MSDKLTRLREKFGAYKAYFCSCGWRSEATLYDWVLPDETCPQCKREMCFVLFSKQDKARAEKIVGATLEIESES